MLTVVVAVIVAAPLLLVRVGRPDLHRWQCFRAVAGPGRTAGGEEPTQMEPAAVKWQHEEEQQGQHKQNERSGGRADQSDLVFDWPRNGSTSGSARPTLLVICSQHRTPLKIPLTDTLVFSFASLVKPAIWRPNFACRIHSNGSAASTRRRYPTRVLSNSSSKAFRPRSPCFSTPPPTNVSVPKRCHSA